MFGGPTTGKSMRKVQKLRLSSERAHLLHDVLVLEVLSSLVQLCPLYRRQDVGNTTSYMLYIMQYINLNLYALKKNYMYNIHVCIEFSWVMLRGRSCSHCKQRAMREKRACIMQGEKSSSVCPVIRHRPVPGAKLQQELHATPRPEHTRSSIWWLEINIFKCLVLDGV